MTPRYQQSLHNTQVIFGLEAVKAFINEELPLEALIKLGVAKQYSFLSLEELNAFTLGLNEAEGFMDLEIIHDSGLPPSIQSIFPDPKPKKGRRKK